MFNRLKIREKLTLQLTILVSILFLTIAIAIYFFTKLYLDKRFYKRLQDRAISTYSLYFEFKAPQFEILRFIDNLDNEYLSEQQITIYHERNKLFVFTSHIETEAFHSSFLPKVNQTGVVFEIKKDDYKAKILRIPQPDSNYLIIVSAKDHTTPQALSDLKFILTILGLTALLGIGFLSYFFTEKAISPLQQIEHQLEDIFPRNTHKRITSNHSEDEVSQLIHTLNSLLDRIEDNMYSQKLFLANISHEIKNPLTKIYSQIELLKLKYPEAENKKEIEHLRNDTHRLIKLSESIIQLAGIYSAEYALQKSDVRIDEILLNTISEIKKWNPEALIRFSMEEGFKFKDADLLEKTGNAQALEILFKNLIENAIKFSPNQSAKVKLETKNKKISVKISNESKIISSEEIKKIFEPFYRVNSTAKAQKGYGVGLAIAKKMVEIHNGEIKVESNENETTFTVFL